LFFRFLNSILKITNIDNFNSSGYFKLAIMGTEAIITKSIAGKKIGVLFIFKLLHNYNTNTVLGYVTYFSNFR
jgi:hypothetical protein